MKLLFMICLSLFTLNVINLQQHTTTIYNVTKTNANIAIGNLQIGQSGVIVHKFKNNKSSILAQAIVIKTDKNNSTIKFIKTDILKQDAIPMTNLKPENNDTFILNHLYNTSLLIAPNYTTKIKIENIFYKTSFLNSDIFAAWLKMNNIPVPTKEDIQQFSKKNNIGTIYIQSLNKLKIIDTLSFKVIQTIPLKVDDNKTQVPFFTNVQDIKTSAFSWFTKEKIENYNKYWTDLH